MPTTITVLSSKYMARQARSLPHFSHNCWTPTDPSAWTPDDPHQHNAQQYQCICGKNFPTIQRLQWNVSRVPPLVKSTQPNFVTSLASEELMYVIYHEETRAVLLCGMARFPVYGGNKPSSTYAEASTAFLALRHAFRILHPGNEHATHTDSLSSAHGWDRSGRTMSTRAFLADKVALVWLAVRTLIRDHAHTHNHTLIKILWQFTEHGRLWSDPMRWMARGRFRVFTC